jgi:hypothetical protein
VPRSVGRGAFQRIAWASKAARRHQDCRRWRLRNRRHRRERERLQRWDQEGERNDAAQNSIYLLAHWPHTWGTSDNKNRARSRIDVTSSTKERGTSGRTRRPMRGSTVGSGAGGSPAAANSPFLARRKARTKVTSFQAASRAGCASGSALCTRKTPKRIAGKK